jgi:hypothetical protein
MNVSVSQIVIGALVVVGFFGSFAMLLTKPDTISEINREPVMMMIGALIAAFSGLMGFFFGSSAGSARKTDIIAKQSAAADRVAATAATEAVKREECS